MANEFMKYPIKKTRSKLASKLTNHLDIDATVSEKLTDVVCAPGVLRSRVQSAFANGGLDAEFTREGNVVSSVLTRVWSQGLIPPLGIFSREIGGDLGEMETDSTGFLRIRVSDMSEVVTFLQKSLEPCWSPTYRKETRSRIRTYGILSPITATMIRIESPFESMWALMGLHGADRIRQVHYILDIESPLSFSPEGQKRRLQKQRARMQALDSLSPEASLSEYCVDGEAEVCSAPYIQYRSNNQEIPVRLILKVSGPDSVAVIASYLNNFREGTKAHAPVSTAPFWKPRGSVLTHSTESQAGLEEIRKPLLAGG